MLRPMTLHAQAFEPRGGNANCGLQQQTTSQLMLKRDHEDSEWDASVLLPQFQSLLPGLVQCYLRVCFPGLMVNTGDLSNGCLCALLPDAPMCAPAASVV